MLIVPFYAALLALIFVALSVRTLRLRRRLKIGIGDGGDPQMLRAMRVHANFAEYVPLSLILLYFAELQGTPTGVAHLLGGALLIGRLTHAYGVAQVSENYRFRVFGMALTFTTILVAASFVLFAYVSDWNAY
jgi:uncharacterized membrane protein YecN with MAPEG domain